MIGRTGNMWEVRGGVQCADSGLVLSAKSCLAFEEGWGEWSWSSYIALVFSLWVAC